MQRRVTFGVVREALRRCLLGIASSVYVQHLAAPSVRSVRYPRSVIVVSAESLIRVPAEAILP